MKLEIECGVQPNCSEATIRLIAKSEKIMKKIVKVCQKLENLYSSTAHSFNWERDEIRGTKGITIDGSAVYYDADDIIHTIREAVGKLVLDPRTHELTGGCSYVEGREVTCYECEAIYCPYDDPKPSVVRVPWKKCPKCGASLFFNDEGNEWFCNWLPCRVRKKATPQEVARILAERLRGEEYEDTRAR
jgi:ribosomal protein S27AE